MHKGCFALPQGSKALPPARLICRQVSPSIQESFLFHSSLLEAQVPSRPPPPPFSFVLLSYVEVFLPFWKVEVFYQHSISVLWKLFYLYICYICGRKWVHVPLLSHLPHISILKCIHSRVYVVLTKLKRLNDSSLPTFPAKLCLALPFQFCLLYSVFQTPNCSDNFIPFIPLHPQPGLYPCVFSFLQFFHFQLLCLQYQKSLILDVRTIEKITPGDFFCYNFFSFKSVYNNS